MLINLSEDSIITFMSMLYPVNEYDSVSAKKNLTAMDVRVRLQ